MENVAFSLNEEDYDNDPSYIIDNIEDHEFVYIGEKIEQKHSNFINTWPIVLNFNLLKFNLTFSKWMVV